MTGDATRNKPAEDLTITLYTAYSDASLYFAFRVHDQFVDAQEADRNEPWKNDGVEVFIDGDRVPNDLTSMTFVRHTAGISVPQRASSSSQTRPGTN